jgi:hypothetical protein
MHEFYPILSVNMTYTRLEYYTTMVIGEHIKSNIRSCDYCVVAFDVVIDIIVPTSARSSLILDKVFFQICLNMSNQN